MKPGDRLVCVFAKYTDVGQEFTDWPLHVTIVPWFRVDTSSGELAKMFDAQLSDIKPFEIVMAEESQFGYHKGKTATLVQEPTPLSEIEKIVRETLKHLDAWIVDETTKVKRQFRPHITAQRGAGLKRGDKLKCDRLYIVEQKGGYKKVDAEIIL